MTARVVADLSKLPASGFRQHGLWFWAGLGFMAIEAAGFALACGSYIYLMHDAEHWPLIGKPPSLVWGTLQTLVMLASLWPNAKASNASRRRILGPTRLWAVVLTSVAAVCLVIRGFEFGALNARWDQDAYRSIVWALLLLHTLHIVTDFIDSAFLTVFLFTHSVDNERFSDVDDDCVYWGFVVATWIPIYLLVYWAPRLAA